MKFLQTGLLLGFAVISATGCSATGKAKADGVGIGHVGNNSAVAAPSDDASSNDSNGPLTQRIIYFVNDSNEVLPESLSVVNHHAAYLAVNKSKSVVLEGHADERGSPEYNIALGEQSAQTVGTLMKRQGVGESQIRLLSFGEEKPAVSGHDENTWRLNRRVEITYSE